jgi:hypothetical protein
MEELRSLANSCWVVKLVLLVVVADAIAVDFVAGKGDDAVEEEESLPSPTDVLPPPPPVLRG